MYHARKLRTACCLTLTVALLLPSFAVAPPQAFAQQAQIVKLERIITIDDKGNARVEFSIKFPSTWSYNVVKKEFEQNMSGNMAVLLRMLGSGHHWGELSEVEGEFDDDTRSIVIGYGQKGIAKGESGTGWKVDFESDATLDLLSKHDEEFVFNTIENTDLGLAQLVVKLRLPKGASGAEYREQPSGIVYQLEPKAESALGRVKASYELEAKDAVMSALAKSYAQEEFSYFWTARQVFTNTGSRTLTNYRVRFRIAGFSSWSPWKGTERIVPGGTVVEPFYPVFDIDKVAAITGSRPVMLEMEMEYQRPDGTVVKESDTRRLELLARNDVIYSSMGSTEATGYYDHFDCGEVICASFVTSEDPVMQQFAGAIAQMLGGTQAGYTDEEAIKFLAGIQHFLAINNISYQSPPGLLVAGKLRQHVKYGRDVLRNRAGTCIDLAILYASACKAVGLKPFLVLVPGHCFMGVHLPSGKRLAVECTVLEQGGFVSAVKAGQKALAEAEQGLSIIVDINEMRDMGVQPLDLPQMSNTFLEDKGYTVELPEGLDQAEEEEDASPDSGVVGKWGFQGRVNGVMMIMAGVLQANGQFASIARITNNDGSMQEYADEGTYRIEGSVIVATGRDGTTMRRPFRLENDQLYITYNELNATVPFERMQ